MTQREGELEEAFVPIPSSAGPAEAGCGVSVVEQRQRECAQGDSGWGEPQPQTLLGANGPPPHGCCQP